MKDSKKEESHVQAHRDRLERTLPMTELRILWNYPSIRESIRWAYKVSESIFNRLQLYFYEWQLIIENSLYRSYSLHHDFNRNECLECSGSSISRILHSIVRLLRENKGWSFSLFSVIVLSLIVCTTLSFKISNERTLSSSSMPMTSGSAPTPVHAVHIEHAHNYTDPCRRRSPLALCVRQTTRDSKRSEINHEE